jgi:hypothetical protein
MKYCCPPGQGCNDPDGTGRCALTLCRAAADDSDDAALALERWRAWQLSCSERQSRGEQRFRRRAFQRARDRALLRLAMKTKRPHRRRRGSGTSRLIAT